MPSNNVSIGSALVLATLAATIISTQQTTSAQTLAKLTRDVSQLKLLATRAYNNFDILKRQKGPFTKVIVDLKQHRHKLKTVQAQINTALASNSMFSFIERMVLQFHRIQVDKLTHIFEWIGTELLTHFGLNGGTSEFTSLHFSETVEIANSVAHYRFVQMIASANETNKLITAALDQALNGTKVAPETKNQIDRQLEALLKEATKARVELSQEYYSEVEKFIEEKRELNLLQKMQLEKFRDAFQFVVRFVRAYQRMLKRLLKQ